MHSWPCTLSVPSYYIYSAKLLYIHCQCQVNYYGRNTRKNGARYSALMLASHCCDVSCNLGASCCCSRSHVAGRVSFYGRITLQLGCCKVATLAATRRAEVMVLSMLKTIFFFGCDLTNTLVKRRGSFPTHKSTRRYIAPRSHRSHQGYYYLVPNTLYDRMHKCDILWFKI